MNAGSKEPDWGKFGLEGERQPLNPGSSTSGLNKKSKEDLFGGHVVNDNELFADDQVIPYEIMFNPDTYMSHS